MRIRPVFNKTRSITNKNSINNHDVKVVSKGGIANNGSSKAHKYSGDVCADLAYASFFDNRILNELKLMGLI